MRQMSRSSESAEQHFAGFKHLLEKFVGGRLTINQVQKLSRDIVAIRTDPNAFSSEACDNNNGTHDILIGEKMVPADIQRRLKWGARTIEGQFLVKVSHEYAHIIQPMFDRELVPWLDKTSNEIPDWCEPYARLYAGLTETGPLTGLANEPYYHGRGRYTENLRSPTYEDMAELIGAYMISEEYLAFRLKHIYVELPQDILDGFHSLIRKIVGHYVQEKSKGLQ